MITNQVKGVFLGRARVTKRSRQGGARYVFTDIAGAKNYLVSLPFGGILQNPFPGIAKLYAGDIFWMDYDDKGENPKLYCLKTYEAVSANAKVLNIVRDGYHHIPFPGDKIGVAPEKIGGAMTAATVVKVEKGSVDGQNVWELTLDTALTVTKGDILVEADADNKMLIKDINAFAPCDYDFCFEPVADPSDADDYEDAQYALTPVAGTLAYIHRMSPMPKCVLDLNMCRLNGIFGFNSLP